MRQAKTLQKCSSSSAAVWPEGCELIYAVGLCAPRDPRQKSSGDMLDTAYVYSQYFAATGYWLLSRPIQSIESDSARANLIWLGNRPIITYAKVIKNIIVIYCRLLPCPVVGMSIYLAIASSAFSGLDSIISTNDCSSWNCYCGCIKRIEEGYD